MTVKTTRWDVTESLDTDERIAGFIKVALEDGGDDPWMAASLLDDMARAIGMNEIARRTGIAREQLYQALDSANDHRKPTVTDILIRISEKLGARTAVEHEAAE